jgi:hypothetical protein
VFPSKLRAMNQLQSSKFLLFERTKNRQK